MFNCIFVRCLLPCPDPKALDLDCECTRLAGVHRFEGVASGLIIGVRCLVPFWSACGHLCSPTPLLSLPFGQSCTPHSLCAPCIASTGSTWHGSRGSDQSVYSDP